MADASLASLRRQGITAWVKGAGATSWLHWGLAKTVTHRCAQSPHPSAPEELRRAPAARDTQPPGRGPVSILVLSASVGSGHTRAADAVCEAAAPRGAAVSVTHVDALGLMSASFRRAYAGWYLALAGRHPDVWSWLYRATNDPAPESWAGRLRRRVERLHARRLLRQVVAAQPDLVLCTHFMPAELLAREVVEGRLRSPVWVAVTDFDLHRMWVHEGISGYFAANEEVAYRMRARHIPPERIHVTGIPVMQDFQRQFDRRACARRLGINPQRTTLLLMGGGAGFGTLVEVAERLIRLPGDFQLLVLAGTNGVALDGLHRLAALHPGRLFASGFTSHVASWMACADLVITKPGGLTVAESLAMGLPMIVHGAIPGQEERNADFLLEHGAALKATDGVTLEYRVRYLMDHPEALASMRRRARALGRSDSARAVLRVLIDTVT
ncbi:MAG: galactosyldiacylglycerol synthase [Herminiimonas sp.]|nr:galactosyldiacylglycerol synthase [Herminiimonas sp.]